MTHARCHRRRAIAEWVSVCPERVRYITNLGSVSTAESASTSTTEVSARTAAPAMLSAASPRVAAAATAAGPRSAREGSPARGISRATGVGTRARKPPSFAPSPARSARPATTRRAVPDAAQALAVAETAAVIARDAATRPPSPAVGDLAEGSFLSPALPLLAILGGLGIYKAAVYWRVQFITASMIGRHVPPARGASWSTASGRARTCTTTLRPLGWWWASTRTRRRTC